jgi:hypothetical protein
MFAGATVAPIVDEHLPALFAELPLLNSLFFSVDGSLSLLRRRLVFAVHALGK